MSDLARKIAWEHCRVYDPDRAFDGCKCGERVVDRAWLEHVVEVAQAAAREQVATEIEAMGKRWKSSAARSRPTGDQYWHVTMQRVLADAAAKCMDIAARIARGEVKP